MTLPATMAQEVQGLIKLESECCSFLNLELSIANEHLTLDMTAADPDAIAVISLLAGTDLA